MSLKSFQAGSLPAIEQELHQSVSVLDSIGAQDLRTILAYHLGWEGEGAGPEASGKRIRPLLVLLSTAAAGKPWQTALPAGAAVELVHNFSLIHDDIEDHSELRRGRPTVWKRWGVPQAINAGDALFTLAFLAISRLEATASAAIALQSACILQRACLHLTHGQYLDLEYQDRQDLAVDDYWPMVSGKTAALIAACTELGALIGGADSTRQEAYRRFGQLLGLAFQVKDDLLGIWGDAALTGKSAESDLLEGKKSLPVLYGLSQAGAFARRWAQGPVQPGEVKQLATQLEVEGARRYVTEAADRLTQEALETLEEIQPQGEAGAALFELANWLLGRSS